MHPGGKLITGEDVYMIVNRGRKVEIVDVTINNLHAESGLTKITSDTDVKNQSGSAPVERDNNIKLQNN